MSSARQVLGRVGYEGDEVDAEDLRHRADRQRNACQDAQGGAPRQPGPERLKRPRACTACEFPHYNTDLGERPHWASPRFVETLEARICGSMEGVLVGAPKYLGGFTKDAVALPESSGTPVAAVARRLRANSEPLRKLRPRSTRLGSGRGIGRGRPGDPDRARGVAHAEQAGPRAGTREGDPP